MEKVNDRVTRYYTCDHPDFFVEVVKKGSGRDSEYEAWLGKDGSGVMDFMFGLISHSEQEFLDIVEANLDEYVSMWDIDHV